MKGSAMNKRSWFSRTAAVTAGFLLVVACGEDDPDSTFVDGNNGKIDGGTSGIVDPIGLGDGSASLDGGGLQDDGGACAASSARADVAQLDLVMLVDSSGSMNFNGKWQSLTKALQAFFADPRAEGIGVSLQYFPQFVGPYPVCDDAVYATPVINVLPLDQSHAGTLGQSLMGRSPLGGTPMGPAVQGSLRFATTWQKQNPNRKVVMVVATDGLPDEGCQFGPPGRAPNTIAAVQTQAQTAFGATPSVPTYVIGVGSELAPLDAVAAAGGTSKSILIDVTKDVTSQLFTALDKIRRTELTCEYTIPAQDPTKPAIDYGKVNVKFTDALGYVDFQYVETPANCSKAEYGWYYDDPNNPKRVVLCEPFCSEVKASRLGKVDVLLGCKRVDAPIVK